MFNTTLKPLIGLFQLQGTPLALSQRLISTSTFVLGLRSHYTHFQGFDALFFDWLPTWSQKDKGQTLLQSAIDYDTPQQRDSKAAMILSARSEGCTTTVEGSSLESTKNASKLGGDMVFHLAAPVEAENTKVMPQ